jgi:virginiamycin A acetyltransferase
MFIINSRLKRKALNLYLRIAGYRHKDDIFIARGSLIGSDISIREGTRINGPITIRGLGKVSFGKYCAIGDNVRIITSNHDINYLNLQYALQKKISDKTFSSKAGEVTIKNNVWIGDSTIILPEVKIGNCAIIGAGAVVTKDVPDFCIYAGNPAKLIRKRFSEELIQLLEKVAWWEWPLEKLKKHRRLFEKNVLGAEEEIIHQLNAIMEDSSIIPRSPGERRATTPMAKKGF